MKTGRQSGPSQQRCMSHRRAFTLIDVLVSIFVIAILISLLLPKMSMVHETARRVVCQSNIRQIGIGVMAFANDYKGELPNSDFLSHGSGPARSVARPQFMDTLRIPASDTQPVAKWDGLGILYNSDYVNAPKVYYCPSHRGDKPFARFVGLFESDAGEILSNYHYRGEGPMGHGPNGPRTRNLDKIDPSQSSLVADGMQLRSDYNHRIGANFFRADLTVHWFAAPEVPLDLPETKEAAEQDTYYVSEIWQKMDEAANAEAGFEP